MHYDGQPMQSAVAAEILDCRGYTFAKTRNPGNDGGGIPGRSPPVRGAEPPEPGEWAIACLKE